MHFNSIKLEQYCRSQKRPRELVYARTGPWDWLPFAVCLTPVILDATVHCYFWVAIFTFLRCEWWQGPRTSELDLCFIRGYVTETGFSFEEPEICELKYTGSMHKWCGEVVRDHI